MSSMIGHRYCQFIQTFIITITTAFSSPQEYQGQLDDLHLVFNAPFGSFDAAASSKDPINAIPKVTLDQSRLCTRMHRIPKNKTKI